MSYSLHKLSKVDKSELPNGYQIMAPLSGDIQPLAAMEHAMLNGGALGEGVCILVKGNKLYAPVDGQITEISASGHRIQFKAANGIKLLLLFGPPTEKLMGEGFNCHITNGQMVKKGQLMGDFNLQKRQINHPDRLHYAALTISNAELLGQIYYANDKVTAAEDMILTATAKTATE